METSEMWDVRVAAYCLMPNHYHMLVQTPGANISRSMRHLNGVYTQRYNSRCKCDGQLFRGRYKSILIDADSYLLQAVRYIHRNPLKANLAENLDEYKKNEARNAAIYLTRKLRLDTFKQIGDHTELTTTGRSGVCVYE